MKSHELAVILIAFLLVANYVGFYHACMSVCLLIVVAGCCQLGARLLARLQ